MPLTEPVKTDVIRHMGFPVLGLYQLGAAGGALAYGNMGYRFFGASGQLLYRLNLLRPLEEASITGLATGSISFTGQGPNVGDSFTVTLAGAFTGSPISVTITVPQAATPWTLNTVASHLAAAFSSQPAFTAAGFFAVADYGASPFSQSQTTLPVCSILGPTGLNSFTLTVSALTGTTVPQIALAGQPVSPFISFRQLGVINTVYGFVPILNFLDAAYGGATTNLAVATANNTTLRQDELEQREEQYQRYRRMLAQFLGIPLANPGDNPALGAGGGGCNLVY
jgi:hypothetical protein